MKFQLSTNQKRKSAFTLIEIMVATVIMVVLVGLVIQITSEVLKVWNRSSGKLSANADARIALQLVTQDLETAVFRSNGLRWLEAEDQDIKKSIAGDVAGYAPQTVSLSLYTPAADRPVVDDAGTTIAGDICFVQYQLVYKDAVTGRDEAVNNTFALHRRVIDASTTFKDLMGEPDQLTFDNWKEGAISPTAGVSIDGGYKDTSDPENYLVGNIASFTVDFYVVNSDGEEVLVDEDAILYGGTGATVGSTASNEDYRYPLAYAELSLTVLSDEGTRILQSLDAGFGGTGYESGDGEEVIKQHGEVYTRRINFVRPL
ncbi:MAG: PulJ/GspJ family protein [Opitutaceae bacterium]